MRVIVLVRFMGLSNYLKGIKLDLAVTSAFAVFPSHVIVSPLDKINVANERV